jgi:hypothetical protein
MITMLDFLAALGSIWSEHLTQKSDGATIATFLF